ncbi:MAG: hypothetical protein OK422_02115 [Thaumarchaeota archaeon]|nr:hypothetical protein [Nitrososphaerota archaeon]
MESGGSDQKEKNVEKIFAGFDEAWLRYWNAYISLQNQLYETARAAREVSWLSATDPAKLSDINRVQRELYATMPRRVDYQPLGQVTRSLDSAPTTFEALEAALILEKEKCQELEKAIDVVLEQTRESKKKLGLSGP